MSTIFEIDDVIPFCQRDGHKSHTIREIIRYDSGYLKDLFICDKRVVFSSNCLSEIKRLTDGHYDNWEPPKSDNARIFSSKKTYGTPYLYDFNNKEIEDTNNERLLYIRS